MTVNMWIGEQVDINGRVYSELKSKLERFGYSS